MRPDPVSRWREWLEGWRIPDDILARAPEDPWAFPVELFTRRAESSPGRETPSDRRALEALPEGGTVLDVGSGAGAASLPLAPPARRIVAVDRMAEMLRSFAVLAEERGVDHVEVVGGWPEVAAAASPADVVLCHHVLYNVADLEPFVLALTSHARARVVCELMTEHPAMATRDLWQRFHGLDRPAGPTANDAVAALRALGVDPAREDFEPPTVTGFDDRRDAVAMVRRRLCLSPDRDPEIEAALGDRLACLDGTWSVRTPGRRLATLWWDA